jgi:hypothetical protein
MFYKNTTPHATNYLIYDGKKGTEFTVKKDDSEVIVKPTPASKAVNDSNIKYYWRATTRIDTHDLIKAIMTRTIAHE